MSQQFTGRHFLLIMVAFFGVIVAVNITMAVYANTSWTGFVVRNSYVAGLEFNRKSREHREQVALGWNTTVTGTDGTFRFALADAEGNPVALKAGTAQFRRPVTDAEDTTLALADGAWIVEIEADAGRDVPWHEIHRIIVRDGAIR
jgi:nitrogen fixation protein FixH